MMQPPDDSPRQSGTAISTDSAIVLVGASVRAAAESAAKTGRRVIGIDLFGDTDTRQACESFFLLQDVDWQNVQAVSQGAPVIQVGGVNSAELSQQLMARSGASESAMRCQDPIVLRRIAEASGVRFPTTTAASDQRPDAGRWLVKQTGSSGGLGVHWDELNDLPEATSSWRQQWIAGRSFGVTFIGGVDGTQLLGVCRSLFTRSSGPSGMVPFMYCGSLGPLAISDSQHRQLQQLGAEVVKQTGVSGLFNVDLIIQKSGACYLLEINPRWSASSELIERNMSGSLIARHLTAIHERSQESEISDAKQSGRSLFFKRVIFARQPLRFVWQRFADLQTSQFSLHDIPRDGTLVGCGEPVFTALVEIPRQQPNWAWGDWLPRLREVNQRLIDAAIR